MKRVFFCCAVLLALSGCNDDPEQDMVKQLNLAADRAEAESCKAGIGAYFEQVAQNVGRDKLLAIQKLADQASVEKQAAPAKARLAKACGVGG